MLASSGAVCYDCMAREVCDSLSKERGIDTSKQTPPCQEAWLKWAEAEEKCFKLSSFS